MKYDYDISVIGAGSGGLVVASAAVGMGAKVLLIEDRKMGGDCLNYGCVPSKAFLKSAHLAQKMRKSHRYGLHDTAFSPSMADIMRRVHDVIAEIAPHDSVERYKGLGVDVKLGRGSIVDAHTVSVKAESSTTNYTSKAIVIATGSRAFIPPIKGLDSVNYLTNESVFSLETLPKELIVFGAGPIGLELGQGFAHLGSKVHIVDRSPSLFSKDDPDVSGIMTRAIEYDGVKLYLSAAIDEVSQQGDRITVKITKDGTQQEIIGDALLVSLGRAPNSGGLGLEEVGVKTNARGYIEVDDYLRTSVKSIYACGDVRGKFQFTHSAGYEATVVVKNALIAPVFKAKYHNIAWTTYTVPEVAHVGMSLKDATESGVLSYTHKLPISDNDRAKAEDDREGFVKVLLDKKHRVLGATIVSDKAGEMLPILSLLVTKRMKLGELMSVIYQYPIQGEILKSLALIDFKSSAKEWQRSLLKKIVTR